MMKNSEIFQYLSLVRYKAIPPILKIFYEKKISIILDFEDSAKDLFSKKNTLELKKLCRKGLIFLSNSKFKNATKNYVRINDIKSSHFKKDIVSIKKSLKNGIKIKALFLPKVETYEHIKKVYKIINFRLKKKIKIIPIIESNKALLNLNDILEKDNLNIIEGVHYGHFDYCLDRNLWPLPEPYHLEYWNIINKIAMSLAKFNKRFIQTPFPLIQNHNFFWSSFKYLNEKYPDLNCSMSLVNYNPKFTNVPKFIKKLRLKKMSNNKTYNITFAKKIIKYYLESKSKRKSFSLSNKRFIPPHQYIIAKKYLKKYDIKRK